MKINAILSRRFISNSARVAFIMLTFTAFLAFVSIEGRAQYAVGVSAISVNLQAVDTYSATWLDPVANYYYDPYVEGYLFERPFVGGFSLIRSGSAYGGEYDTADGYMNAPTKIDHFYQHESDHYVVAYFSYYDPVLALDLYHNPYGYGFASHGDPSWPSGYQFLPGSQEEWVEARYLYLGTTAVTAKTFLPRINAVDPRNIVRGSSGYLVCYGTDMEQIYSAEVIGGGMTSLAIAYRAPNGHQVNLQYTVDPNTNTGQRVLRVNNFWGFSPSTSEFTIFDFTVTHNKVADGVRPTGIVAGLRGAEPAITEDQTQATVTISTEPPINNLTFNLEVRLNSNSNQFSGHFGPTPHTGTRPLGTLDHASRMTDGNGRFNVVYEAPVFGGREDIRATPVISYITSSTTRTGEIDVLVQGLVDLPPGPGYVLTGQTLPDGRTLHPSNHWGTAIAVSNLQLIASDYQAAYPGAEALRYNDMSLPRGGKFEVAGNWGDGSHGEHRFGRNCDLRMSDVPVANRQMLLQIFTNRGVQDPHPEPGDNHWHLRFFVTP